MTLLPPGVRSTWPSLHRHAQGHRRRCHAGPRRAAAGSLFWAPLFVPRSDGLWLRFGQTWAYRLANVMSALPSILLQKSKIKRLRKSRESRFLDVSATAKLSRADTKAGGRFRMKRCGPSCRRVRNASREPASGKSGIRRGIGPGLDQQWSAMPVVLRDRRGRLV